LVVVIPVIIPDRSRHTSTVETRWAPRRQLALEPALNAIADERVVRVDQVDLSVRRYTPARYR
jgi:hypothetical protein